MKVKTFAVLKEHLGEEFEIETVANIEQLKQVLATKNPKVDSLLSSCRFAVGNTFANAETVFTASDILYVLPPSSGG